MDKVNVTRGALGGQLPGMQDLLSQLTNMLGDETPGGLSDLRSKAGSVITQLQDELERVRQDQATLEGQISLMEGQLRTLGDAMLQGGVTRAEFSGQWPGVLDTLRSRQGEMAGAGQNVYGILLLASTPQADRALSAVIGLGRTMRLVR